MTCRIPFLACAIFVCCVLISKNSFAAGSGAFRAETPDAGAYGKGSAFVGEANTPAAIYYNPAGLNQMKTAGISVGTTFIAPQFNYSSSSDDVQMRRNTFWIPHLYATVPITNKFAVGVGETSYFGLGTQWADDSPLRYIATESVIENKDYMFAASYQASNHWSFAVSADLDDSKAEKNRKLLQTGGTDGDLKLKGADAAWGYRLAAMFKLNDQNQFGLMYRSRIFHKYEGNAYLDNLNNNGNFYQTIFGDTSYKTKISEKFALPQSIVLGYSFKTKNKWTFNFDVEWMDWSSIKREAINFLDETDPTRLAVLNTGNPTSRNWESVWSEAVGAEYAVNDRFRLRTGYVHHSNPIPEETFDPSLPDANSHGLSAGWGYDVTKHLTVDLGYSFIVYERRNIDNTVGNIFGANVDGKYTAYLNVALMTLSYKF